VVPLSLDFVHEVLVRKFRMLINARIDPRLGFLRPGKQQEDYQGKELWEACLPDIWILLCSTSAIRLSAAITIGRNRAYIRQDSMHVTAFIGYDLAAAF
jgi:hypothetical protein